MDDSSESLEEILFDLAIQKPTVAERAAFLDVVCRGNVTLRARLDGMLDVHFRQGGFLSGLVVPDPPAATFPSAIGSEAPSPTIAGYKLLEKIGEGGFGDVWMAEQRTPIKRRVALKIIKPGMDSRQVVARFEAERQALALMDHPNIARIYDAGSSEAGRPYFVMELVRGSKITDYCDQNRLSTNERLRLFMQICHAVQHAHQKGIIHRDLKPSNILITLHDGVPVPKVIDFGIAKAMQQELTDKTLFTQFSQFIGTPAYISPEQAELSGLDVDTRADIYSLGVLLYELLVGRTPFDAKEMLQDGIDALRRTIREQEPTKPSTKLATLAAVDRTATAQRRQTDATRLTHLLRGDLDWIVMKCLEKDRARRYETANGLSMDIQRYLSNEPVSARRPSRAYQLKKAWQRNRLLATTLAAVALAVSVGLAVSIWQTLVATKARQEERAQRLLARDAQTTAETEHRRADEQASRAVANEQRARRLLYCSDMNLVQQALQLNHLEKARRLLDRHRPQAGEEDLRGWEWRYLWQLTRGNDRVTLTMRPSPGSSVSLSPDGTSLAVGWRDGQVDLWDVEARQRIRELTPRNSDQIGQVAFSPVGNVLVATSSRGVVTRYDLDSGRESIVFQLPDGELFWISELTFSSDGTRLLVYGRGANLDSVWIVDVTAAAVIGHHDALPSNPGVWFGVARLSPDNRRLFLSRNDHFNNRCTIQCLDLATGKEVWEIPPIRDLGITALVLSPDGRLLASGSGFGDPVIRIWDAATGQLVTRLEGHTAWVSELKFSADGRRLISASADSSILRWNTDTWIDPTPLRGHADEIHAMSISESGQLVATAGKDGSLIVWRSQADDISDGHRILPDLDWGQVLPVDNSRLLLLYPDSAPSLLDLQSTSPPRPLEGIRSSADVLDWLAPDRLCYWSGGNELILSELNGLVLTQRQTIELNSNRRPGGVAFNAGRQLLAWTEASAEESMWVVDLSTPGSRIELKSDAIIFAPFGFSSDGSYLAGRCEGEWRLRVWEVATGKVVASVAGDVADAVFAAGGQVLVAAIRAQHDHEFVFYDLRHPEQAPRRVSGSFLPRSLSVTPDGLLVAGSTHDGRVRFFDPITATVVDEVRGQLNAFGVAFSPDGQRLTSASVGREAINLWDSQTRQELLTLASAATLHMTVRWTADGNAILVGSPIEVWHAPSWDEIAEAEAKEHAGPDARTSVP